MKNRLFILSILFIINGCVHNNDYTVTDIINGNTIKIDNKYIIEIIGASNTNKNYNYLLDNLHQKNVRLTNKYFEEITSLSSDIKQVNVLFNSRNECVTKYLDKVNENAIDNINQKLLEKIFSLKDAIFMVKSRQKFDSISKKQFARVRLGTCFTITNDGKAISNYHVMSSYGKTPLILYANNFEEYLFQGPLFVDQKTDLMLFRIKKVKNIPYLTIDPQKPITKIDEKVFTLGFSDGPPLKMKFGNLIRYRNDSTEFVLPYEMFTHGNSGSPIFNANGSVIGISKSVVLITSNNITSASVEGSYSVAINLKNQKIRKNILNNAAMDH
ncbi:MAG: serine protease [Bacteroidota bacterium]